MIVLSIGAWASGAAAEPLRGPVREVRHPVYEDANGTALMWSDVRALARDSDAVRDVRKRRVGRTVLRITFAGVTAVEAWGTWQLGQHDNFLAVPLGAQTAASALVATLLWTAIPQQRLEDRAHVLSGANRVLVPR